MTATETDEQAPVYGLLAVASIALKHRRRLVWMAAVVALVMSVPALLKTRTYSSAASFAPQAATGDISRMSGLAAQLGIAINPGNNGESPEFFAALVRSREVLEAIAGFAFRMDADKPPEALMTLLRVREGPPEKRLDETVRKLRDMVFAEPVQKTGVVTVTVIANWPLVAHDIADSVLVLVNRFNLDRRQTRAGAERRFVEARLGSIRAELKVHEDSLEKFVMSNRTLGPSLQFSKDRLQQEVDMRRTLATSLAQAFEQARIEEVRNTPVISPVERPDIPVRPDSRRVIVKGLAGIVAGLLIGFLWAVGIEAVRRRRASGDPDVAEVTALLRDTLAELRRPWQAARRPSDR